jgi:Mrp family chromosome partitioning ATPase
MKLRARFSCDFRGGKTQHSRPLHGDGRQTQQSQTELRGSLSSAIQPAELKQLSPNFTLEPACTPRESLMSFALSQLLQNEFHRLSHHACMTVLLRVVDSM